MQNIIIYLITEEKEVRIYVSVYKQFTANGGVVGVQPSRGGGCGAEKT